MPGPEGAEANAGSAEASYRAIERLLSSVEGFSLSDERKRVLKLKLERFAERKGVVDAATLRDAIVETPRFLDSEKGGFHRLLKIHEQKTLARIAEIRKRKAEQEPGEGYNPYSVLFETSEGNAYLARLLNMEHLEEESAFLSHCVGTSDSYINKMRRGDVEIFSLRVKRDPPATDMPVVTIEYDVRRKRILQMKQDGDEEIDGTEFFFPLLMDALEKLRDTADDAGHQRAFTFGRPEVVDTRKEKEKLLTNRGPISFSMYDPDVDTLVLRGGSYDLLDTKYSEPDLKAIAGISSAQTNVSGVVTAERLRRAFATTPHMRGSISFSGLRVDGDAEALRSLALEVDGDLSVYETGIAYLPDSLTVHGDCEILVPIKGLPRDLRVDGDLSLPMQSREEIEDLPNDLFQRVKGKVFFVRLSNDMIQHLRTLPGYSMGRLMEDYGDEAF